MERVTTLIAKLQTQLDAQAPTEQLLQTVQMLYGELMLQKKIPGKEVASSRVMVILPNSASLSSIEPNTENLSSNSEPEDKIIEVLQIDEKEVEDELNEIKRNAESRNQLSAHARPPLLFDPVEDVPTLTHQSPLKKEVEINRTAVAIAESVNDKLKESKVEMGDRLTDAPVKDLKKAIGINDRFLFINELFRGDEAMYERSIKTINNFTILPEAQYWIQRELKVKIGWTENDEVVKQFDQLVRRRFS